jgi:hypothetical protein
MYTHLFNEFLAGGDSLHVYEKGKLIFSSKKDRLLPLLEYIVEFSHDHRQVTIFDKIIGNAAALLAVKVNCQEAYSPLGSQLAIKTLDRYGIKYHFTKITPYILQPNGKDMCPMEKLSINKGPEDFYKAISARMMNHKGG